MAKQQTTEPKRSPDELVSVLEAAAALNCSDDTVYRMVNDGRLESVPVSELIRIPWSEIERIRKSRRPVKQKREVG